MHLVVNKYVCWFFALGMAVSTVAFLVGSWHQTEVCTFRMLLHPVLYTTLALGFFISATVEKSIFHCYISAGLQLVAMVCYLLCYKYGPLNYPNLKPGGMPFVPFTEFMVVFQVFSIVSFATSGTKFGLALLRWESDKDDVVSAA